VVLLVLRALGEGTTLVVTLPLGSAHLPPEQIGGTSNPRVDHGGCYPICGRSPALAPRCGVKPKGISPVAFSARVIVCALSSMEPGANGSRPHILLADDNADMRRYLTRLLAERYSVQATTDGEAALAAACERPPDLV
jgi:hypothetical protein